MKKQDFDAIHILSNYENHPTTITIKLIEYDGKFQWALEYEEFSENEIKERME